MECYFLEKVTFELIPEGVEVVKQVKSQGYR